MNNVAASAPGKVVLSGEYAVLDGAPAVAMALDRRARVAVNDANSNHHIIKSAGRADAHFEQVGDSIRFTAGEHDHSLFAAAWKELAPELTGTRTFTLDTTDFEDPSTGIKFGIGSSAALMVALCAAFSDDPEGPSVAVAATRAHQHFQGGVGSGIDVACSCLGGVIQFRTGDIEPVKLEWPAGLQFALLWSGVAASSKDKLERLGRAEKRVSRISLSDAAVDVAEIWRMGDVEKILGEFGRYVDALRRFDADHRLGVFDAGHGALVDAASEFDVVYKPCGAGGGDIGVALASESDAIEAFIGNASRAGFTPVKSDIDWQGASVLETRCA